MKNNKKILSQWYIATTIIGSEDSIYLSLLDKIKAYKFNDLVQEMKIIKYNDITIETFDNVSNPPPKTMRNSKNITWETTPDGKYIKKTSKTINKFPGYLFISMIMTEEVWYTIRNTPGITGFIGSSGKGTKPIPISQYELKELFDPDKNKDIIRHVNNMSISIEEVDHINDPNPLKSKSDVEFFNSKAITSNVLNTTRKIDFEKRQNIQNEEDDEISSDVQLSSIENLQEEKNTKDEFQVIIKKDEIKEKDIKDEFKVIIKKDNVKEKNINIDKKSPKINLSNSLGGFLVGNTVTIIDGSFKGLEALVVEIDNINEGLTCELDFFGRRTRVKFKKEQIQK